MHASMNRNEIKEAVSNLRHGDINKWNIKQRVTKKPLPMFIVELKQNKNTKSFYEVKYLLHCQIIFEPSRLSARYLSAQNASSMAILKHIVDKVLGV